MMNTTYIVTSCYSKTAKRTVVEMCMMYCLGCLEEDGRLQLSASERNELMKSVRDDEIANQPSFAEYLEKVRKALMKMEFSENDIAILLDKYAEAYKPLS